MTRLALPILVTVVLARVAILPLPSASGNSRGPPFRLGGADLVDFAGGRPLHQVPVPLWTAGGLDMTHNPAWIEPTATGLRAYVMPEDDTSTLYEFEVAAGRSAERAR